MPPFRGIPALMEEFDVPKLKFSSAGAFVALFASLALAGCGQQQPPAGTAAPVATPQPATPPTDQARAPQPAPDQAAPVITLTEADQGTAHSLQRGQVVEIRLEADRAGGYAWVPAENALPVLATDGVPGYEAQDGAPGVEVWRFIAREPGHAHLMFEYRRPQEPDAAPQQSLVYHFDVG
jgi:predicted secreted protein